MDHRLDDLLSGPPITRGRDPDDHASRVRDLGCIDPAGVGDPISAIIYILVGVGAVALVPTLFRWLTADSAATSQA